MEAGKPDNKQTELGVNRCRLTNRWSSRLGGRLQLGVLTRKELESLGVVGGAAQLYVGRPKDPVDDT